MGVSDFSQLSDSTKTLLSYTGMSTNVWSQMRNGNVDYNSVVSGVLNGTNGLNWYQRTTLENLGLGDWVTMGGNYNRNQEEYYNLIEEQYKVLKDIDLTTEEGRAEAEKLNAKQKDDRTFFEKASEGIMSTLGIQNQNWTALLGVIQSMQLIANGIALYSTVKQSTLLKLILASIHKKDISNSVDSILGSKFGGTGGLLSGAGSTIASALGKGGLYAGGASTAIAATAAISGVVAGGAMMYNDYKQNGIKGAFLGNADFNKKSGWDNAVDVLGNTAKYAAIGAAIGTVIPGVGTLLGAGAGALAGAITGLWGGLEGNTAAVEKNTNTLLNTDDSTLQNSALRAYYNKKSQEGLGSNVVYGTNSGGVGGSNDASADYPWPVSSPYGPRDPVYDAAGNLVSQGFHHGVDLAVAEGTRIGAAMSGEVVAAGMAGSAGNQTVIYGDNGKYYRYFHQKQTPPVTPGMRVNAGDVIGYVGTTGASTGPHLHFQVDGGGNESSVSPYPYITGGLFKADGKEYTNPLASTVTGVSANGVSASPGTNATYSIVKESVFGMGGKGGPSSEDLSRDEVAKYATSYDIDRLIKVITDLQAEQVDQRQFMQALAGKNTFVYGRS